MCLHRIAGISSNPVGQTGAYAIGISSAAIGAALLTLGIVDASRSRNSVVDAGEVTTKIQEADHNVACNKLPAGNERLSMVCGKSNPVLLGTTSANGELMVAWGEAK